MESVFRKENSTIQNFQNKVLQTRGERSLEKKCAQKKKFTPATEIQQKQYVQELHEIAKSERSLPVGLSLFKETYSAFSFRDSAFTSGYAVTSFREIHKHAIRGTQHTV